MNWLRRLIQSFRPTAPPTLTPGGIASDPDTIRVEGEEDARLKMAQICFERDGITHGEVDWDEDGDGGTLRVKSS